MVGVPLGVEQLVEPLAGETIGLVLDPLAALVHHHLALGVEVLLGEGGQEEAHAVRFEPQGEVEMVGGHGLVVIGAVEPGRAVGDSADLLDETEMVVSAHMLAPLKEHVLEQVGEPGAARPLVARAHVIPEVDRHQRQGSALVEHDPQAIVEGVA